MLPALRSTNLSIRGTILLAAVVLAAFFNSTANAAEPKQLLILVQGPDGHPPQTHEFVAGGEIMRQLLTDVPDLAVTVVNVEDAAATADGKLAEQIATADGLALYLSQGAKWLAADERQQQAVGKLAQRGGGLFALHWAIGAKEAEYVKPFVALFGACHGGPDRKYKVLETLVTPADHPATKGLQPFKIHDEFYYQLKTDPDHKNFVPLLSVQIEDQQPLVAWAWERPDHGRSAGFSGGHFHANWKRPEYRRFIAQSILWTLHIDIPQKNFPPELDAAAFELPARQGK